MSKTILVTGAAGFIGSHVAQALPCRVMNCLFALTNGLMYHYIW